MEVHSIHLGDKIPFDVEQFPMNPATIKNSQCMKSIFRTVFYLRSNYVNKEGKTPVMLRIYLNNERLCIGSAGVAVEQNQWDSTRERVKGRNTEALSMNLQLDSIQNDLQTIYRKLEMTDDLCLERIKSEYLGRQDNVCTLMQLFEKHNTDIQEQVGVSVSVATLQKYNEVVLTFNICIN